MMITYSSALGEKIDFSRGLIRAVGISGICPERSVRVEENGYTGGAVVSERRGVRRIKLRAVVCGDFEHSRGLIAGVLGLSGSGRLEICGAEGTIGIDCYTENVKADVEDGTNFAEIEFICPNPFFESGGGSDVLVQICGSEGIWEFDDWEISEGNETELSAIISGRSSFVPNNGSYRSGCVITIEMLGEVSEIRAFNAITKEFVGVRGSFSDGDIVIFRCIDGEKGIFLSDRENNSMLEDITHRIIWGSEFWGVAPGGTRVYITTEPEEARISANIRLKEYAEGC